MIRFDGYYLEEPTEVYDGRSKKKSSYFFNAYFFVNKEILRISVKHNHLDQLIDLSREYFNGESFQEREIDIDDRKISIKPGGPFEREIQLEVMDY